MTNRPKVMASPDSPRVAWDDAIRTRISSSNAGQEALKVRFGVLTLDTMERLLTAIGATEQASQARKIRTGPQPPLPAP